MKKIKAVLSLLRNKANNYFLPISVLIACVFLCSPFLLRCYPISRGIDWFFEPLKNSEYKSAFIGAIGGMIGSFLAITGALWVERKLSDDNEHKEQEKIALILFYDIMLFYEEISSLSKNITRVLGLTNNDEKVKKYTEYKNSVGIHIHPDWIGLVASLKGVLTKEEIQKIYIFYGYVSDMKSLIEKDNIEFGNMERVYNAINSIGVVTENKYLPNNEYEIILERLKQIGKI